MMMTLSRVIKTRAHSGITQADMRQGLRLTFCLVIGPVCQTSPSRDSAALWFALPCGVGLRWPAPVLPVSQKRPKGEHHQVHIKGQLFFGLVLPVLYVSQKRPKTKHQVHVKQQIAVLWSGPPCCMFHKKVQGEHHQVHVIQRTAVLWSGPPCVFHSYGQKVCNTKYIENGITIMTQSTLACMHFSLPTGKRGTA